MRLGILVNAYARTFQLEACLSSVLAASNDFECERLVVHQLGVPESTQISEKFKDFFNVDYVNPIGTNAVQRINHTRVMGLAKLFEHNEIDAVLAIEDDIEIARDSVNYCMKILKKFESDRKLDRKSTRLNSSHVSESRMPSSA